MSATDSNSLPASTGRERARRLRIAGIITMLLGLVAAALVYGLEARPDEAAAALTNGDTKTEVRQVETMYGTQGLLVQELQNYLKQPGTQAILILVATGLVAAGCFYVGHLEANSDQTSN